jgi:hypothetical protein
VQILLICGAPGPTSVHTPDVCYRGAGFEMKGKIARHTEEVPGLAPVEMCTAQFHKPQSAFPEQLRIYWTWSTTGEWNAPVYPRWHFAGQTVLYKLYVIRSTLHTGSTDRDEVCMKFLHEFLPEVNKVAFPAAALTTSGPNHE